MVASQVPDPDEPALMATTVSPQLDWAQALLEGMRSAGQKGEGPVQYGTPEVTTIGTDQSTVRSCVGDANITVTAATGQPVPGVAGQVASELFVSTMVLTTGGWKLENQSVEVDQCVAS